MVPTYTSQYILLKIFTADLFFQFPDLALDWQ